MTSLSFTYPPSPTPPLTCDCEGAPVYLRFKSEFANRTREGVGVVHAVLESRSQLSDGTWTYQFSVHEPDLVTPLPSLSGGMVQSICCQGCTGYAAEGFGTNEFGGRLVLDDVELAVENLHVRRFIRSYRLSDVRLWVDAPALAPVTFQLLVNNVPVLASPMTVTAGSYVTSAKPLFVDGKALTIPEGATMKLQIITNGTLATGYGDSSPAKGLEFWGYGHLNPGPYLLDTAGESGVGAPPSYSTGPITELVTLDGATFQMITYPDGRTFYIPGFTTPPA